LQCDKPPKDVFYTYLWLREDGSPYYAGKGICDRGFRSHRHGKVRCPKDPASILVQEFPSEADAFAAEKFLIAYYGRKDLGTGCLRNLTDGGEGSVGAVRTEEFRRKVSDARKGVTLSEETCRKIGDGLRGIQRGPMIREHRHRISEALKSRRHPCSSKLTENQVKEIRALYATGDVTQQLLAGRFSINPSNISFIVSRKSWAHVQ
jgi:hypothetical protein